MRFRWTKLILAAALLLLSGLPVLAQSSQSQVIPQNQVQINPQEVDRLMQQMLQDPESMRLIQELQKDPDMQKILNDPELLDAVSRQDAARLAQDPAVRSLQNNKNIKKLMERNQ